MFNFISVTNPYQNVSSEQEIAKGDLLRCDNTTDRQTIGIPLSTNNYMSSTVRKEPVAVSRVNILPILSTASTPLLTKKDDGVSALEVNKSHSYISKKTPKRTNQGETYKAKTLNTEKTKRNTVTRSPVQITKSLSQVTSQWPAKGQ